MSDPADLASLLEESLVVTCLRADSNISRIKTSRLSQPYTVIGQAADCAVSLEPFHQPPARVPVKGGYILPEDVAYKVDPASPAPHTYHWAHFHFKVLGELDLFQFIESPHAVGAEAGIQIAKINQALALTFKPSDQSVIQIITQRRLLSAQMLSLVVKHCRPRPQAFSTLDKITRLLPVIKFMRDQMARPIFRDELASLTGLSASRFHSLFLDATGQSPLEHLTRIRLKRAQELLLSTAGQVQDIANQVGFRDPFHFTRMFKRFSGQSPRAYRQTVQSQMRQAGD
jgi:AraC-like DNA-binding protein